MKLKHLITATALAAGGSLSLQAGTGGAYSGVGASGKGDLYGAGKGMAVSADAGAGAAAGGSALGLSSIGDMLDPLWDLASIYEDENNPFVQSFALAGRYHGQVYNLDAGDYGETDDYQTRRLRLGFTADLFNKSELEVQWNINKSLDNGGSFFDGLEDVVLATEVADGHELAIGKMKAIGSREFRTSSKRIKTIERSLLVNQTYNKKPWGASYSGESGDIGYTVGAFWGGVDGDNYDFVETDSGYLLNAAIDYEDFSFSALYNDGDAGNNSASSTELLFSASHVNYGKNAYEGLGLFTEVIYGTGLDDGSDVYGLTIMPSYFVAENLEVVCRYHLAISDDDNGIRAQSRYDRAAPDLTGAAERGDTYNGFYGGVNYYIKGQNLKVMAGAEYSDLSGGEEDYDGVTFLAGVRLYF